MASSDYLSSASTAFTQKDPQSPALADPVQDASQLLSKRKHHQVDMVMDDQDTKRTMTNAYARNRFNSDPTIWTQVQPMKESSRTPGVIPRLEPHFTRLNKKGKTVSAYLCSAMTDHISTGLGDLGWGCGYRNTQMLMTFLQRAQQGGDRLLPQVCDIQGIQTLLERAWQEGFDPQGAKQLQQHVYKTRKWIGTTEVYSLLAYLGIRSTILDFHQPTGLHHDALFDWIQFYFESGAKKSHKPKTVYMTDRPPLYLQHAGHSRTVIGIEILKDDKRNLIMFDPGRRMLRSYRQKDPDQRPSTSTATSLPSPNSTTSELDDDGSNHEEDDVDEVSTPKDSDPPSSLASRFLSSITQHTNLPANLLRPFRVDAKTIAKNKQYQVLVLGEVIDERPSGGNAKWDETGGFLLSDEERDQRKRVTSISMTL